VERGANGQCFAERVEKKDIATMDRIVSNYISPGKSILLASDPFSSLIYFLLLRHHAYNRRVERYEEHPISTRANGPPAPHNTSQEENRRWLFKMGQDRANGHHKRMQRRWSHASRSQAVHRANGLRMATSSYQQVRRIECSSQGEAEEDQGLSAPLRRRLYQGGSVAAKLQS
jgi:hypothetical protein